MSSFFCENHSNRDHRHIPTPRTSPPAPHHTPFLSITEIKALLQDHLRDLADECFGQRNAKKSLSHDWRYGNHGSVSIRPKTGQWYDFEIGEGGTPLDLIARLYKLRSNDRHGKIKAAKHWLRLENAPHVPTRPPCPRAAASTSASLLSDQAALRDRILLARRIWADSLPLINTLAARYLANRGIHLRDIEPLLGSLRFDPVRRRLVAKITRIDDPGEIFAVQTITLDHRGHKINYDAKRTNGAKTGRGVVFPGSQKTGPIVICEGIEKALQVWISIAGKWTVVAALGSVNSCRIPRGRSAIIIRDDDPVGSPSHRSAKAFERHIVARGGQCWHAFPWAEKRHDKSDFGDLYEQHGALAVSSRIAAAAPRYVIDDAVPITDLDLSFDSHLLQKRGEITVIRASIGSGKTHSIVNSLNHIDFAERGFSLIVTPEHALGDEIRQTVTQGTGLSAVVVRGREAKHPDNPSRKMCENIELIVEASKLLADVEREVCLTCPLIASCAYIAQKKKLKQSRARVIIISGAAFAAGRLPPGYEPEDCKAIFIDEAITSVIAKQTRIPFPLLDIPAEEHKNLDDQQQADLNWSRQTLSKYLTPFIPAGLEPIEIQTRPTDRSLKELKDAASWMKKLEFARKLGPADVRDWRKREENRTILPLVTLAEAFTPEWNEQSRNWQWTDNRRLHLERNKDRQPQIIITTGCIPAKLRGIPLVFLDALAEPVLIEKTIGPITHLIDKRVSAPHQIIHQDPSRSYSKTWLSRHSNITMTAQRIIDDARQRPSLIVTNKPIIPTLAAALREIDPEFAAKVEFANYNAVAGKNRWSGYDCIFTIGAPTPTREGIASIARAHGVPIQAPETGPWNKKIAKRLILIDGSIAEIDAEVMAGDNEVEDAILRQIGPGQVEQAIGRPRGTRRTADRPVEIFVFGEAVLSFPVKIAKPIAAPSLADTIAKTHGFIVTEASSLAKLTNRSERTVRENLAKDAYRFKPPPGSVAFRFKRQGSGRRLIVGYFDPNRFSPESMKCHLENVFGTLASFEVDLLQPLRRDFYEESEIEIPILLLDESDDADTIVRTLNGPRPPPNIVLY